MSVKKSKIPSVLASLAVLVGIAGSVLTPAAFIDKTYASKAQLNAAFEEIETNDEKIKTLEKHININSAILCAMAMDLDWTNAKQECKNLITR